MVSVSGTDLTTAGIGAAAGYPNLDVASIPRGVQDGDAQAKQAYAEGVAFEGVLVNELSQQLAQTMFGGSASDGSAAGLGALDGSASGDGSGSGSDSSGGSGGLLGAASAYASLIPQVLTTSIVDGGGLSGIAQQFAQELDPSLNDGQTTSGAGGGTIGVAS